MTNEQAIEVLNGHIKDSSIAYGTFTGQALHMAIEALKAQLSQEGTTKGTTSDTISRQAAIDIVEFECGEWQGLAKTIVGEIEHMPSAQPEWKKGYWKHINEEEERAKHNGQLLGWMPWYCSECGCGVGKHQTAFCPNCGAKMERKINGT